RAASVVRGSALSPLVTAHLLFENVPAAEPEAHGWVPFTAIPDGSVAGSAKFDLCLMLVESDDALSGDIQYSTDVFEDGTIARMVRHFEMLLREFAADPTRRLSDLPPLTDLERARLLGEWNQTARADLCGGSVHALVEAQVERTPESVALVFEGDELTY